jgi:DNA processing protein
MAVPLPQTTTTDTLTHWLALYHTPGVGAVTFHQLLEACPTLQDLAQDGCDQLRELGFPQTIITALRQPNTAAVTRDLEWQEKPGNRIMTCHDADYPLLLSLMGTPPPLLYIHGNAGILSTHLLAMVGSRNPTVTGTRTAADFARQLSAAGLVICSGLALGIDAASHRGSLEAGAPTVAVMGTGLDRVYPAQHRDLARQIAEQGVLVSEFPIGTAPRAENFPRRNRIISGLSLGTLVVEAAIRSGSLITARYAGDQGREVFAIPGSINNPLARGCHHLIRQGAKLVETAEDVTDELGMLAASCPAADLVTVNPVMTDMMSVNLDPDYQQLFDCIGFDMTSIDQLVCSSGLTPAEVSSMLLQLELSGYIASSSGGLYNRLK